MQFATNLGNILRQFKRECSLYVYLIFAIQKMDRCKPKQDILERLATVYAIDLEITPPI